MPLPVKFTSPAPLQTIDSSGGARFQVLPPASPTKNEQQSRERAESLQAVAQRSRTPDHAVPASGSGTYWQGGSTPTYREALPWPAVEARLPVRFTGG